MPFTPVGIDHIVLQVRDQAVAEKFYVDILGCTVIRRNPDIHLVQLRFGEHLIDLVPGQGSKHGVEHFCLSIRCDDLEELYNELSGKGVRIDMGIEARTGAYGRSPSFFIRDPDDFLIELKPR